MKPETKKKKIAILGGGPSGLFMYKQLIDSRLTNFSVDIFEARRQLGSGMPYSSNGASPEHITNVSGNEIPEIVTPISEWIRTVPKETLDAFGIDVEKFSDYKVLPRLLFGQYLSAQFDLLKQKADEAHIDTQIHFDSRVTDIIDHPEKGQVCVEINGTEQFGFHQIIVCTGHYWPTPHEGNVPGYFDSPYPPSKLNLSLNHPVALRGSSLSAIDAIRTLGRHNGKFSRDKNNTLSYEPDGERPEFRIVMHSRHGLLPAVRFHLEDSHLSKDSLLNRWQLNRQRAANEGFLSLDFVFDKDFKEPLREKDPEFYARIRNMSIEDFVEDMMSLREKIEPFQLLRAEYAEAAKSIRRHESVYWKEALAVLSFAMNYPAKYLSAEDMLRLQKVLMPLISIVIAFVPQSSCEELMAMHQAGTLDIVAVGNNNRIEPQNEGIIFHYTDEEGREQSVPYKTFVDCIGQPHLSYDQLPFKSLLSKGTVSPATLRFQSAEAAQQELANGNKHVEEDDAGEYFLKVPGIRIDDYFQVVDAQGISNERIFVMAVPFIAGYNPDYSGLDFCEEASQMIVKKLVES